MALIPHLKMPVQRDPRTGKLATVDQGSPEHITSQETSVALCPIGFRSDRPDFGWPIPRMGKTPVDPAPLIQALDRLVPISTQRTAQEYADLAADPTGATRGIEVDTQVNG